MIDSLIGIVEEVGSIIVALIFIALSLLFFYFFYNSGRLVSGSDTSDVKEYKGRILWSVIGIIIAFSLWAIAGLLKSLFIG